MPDRLTEPVMDPGFLDNYVKKTDYVICGVSAGVPAGTFLAAGIRASYEKVYRDTDIYSGRKLFHQRGQT